MKPLEKSTALAVSLKVAVGIVKYIFNIDILVNWKQNNISAVGGMFWQSMFQFLKAAVRRSSEKKVFFKKITADVFLRILQHF